MKLSVIIPVFNPPPSLFEVCLNSILIQTKDYELEFLLIDDGSTEPYVKIMSLQAAGQDARIKYIHKENSGVSDSRNVGIEQSQGKYLMFVDADDYLEPDACKLVIQAMDREEADVIIFRSKDPDDNRQYHNYQKRLSRQEKNDLLRSVVGWSTRHYQDYGLFIDSPWGKIFKKEVINKHGISFPSGLARSGDAVFCLYFYEFSDKIVLDNRFFIYNHVQNPESICFKPSAISARAFPQIMKEKELFVTTYHPVPPFYTALGRRTLVGFLEAGRLYFFNKKNGIPLRTLLGEFNDLMNNEVIRRNIRRMKLSKANGLNEKLICLLIKMRWTYLLFLWKRRYNLF